MDNVENLKRQIMKDFETAKQEFQFYEKLYLGIHDNAKEYLKNQSMKYKRVLSNIQELIQPSIQELCPTCSIQCCKLYTPELSIYIAGSVGGFDCVDYLLVRCLTDLPDACYENAKNNVCPFFNDGCTLPVDCRSYLCIRYFCNDLKKKIDMEPISNYLEEAKSILTDFSFREIIM